MSIALDLDDVLCDLMHPFLHHINSNLGTSYVKENIFSYNFSESFHCSLEETVQVWHDFYKTPQFDAISPYNGSIEAIDYLHKENELFVITGRAEVISEGMAERTLKWVEKNFPNKFSDIIFAKHFMLGGNRKTKSEICDDLKIKLYVDDLTPYALSCVTVSRPVLLFDQPWNQYDAVYGNVHRVYSWKEIVDFVNGMSD
jgi:uncharacterized HAD superfamily protein